MKDDILCIRSDNLTDSLYDIKNALEEPTICRVRKIFAACCNDDPNEHALNSKPNKKVFYIWVEWTNTNASHMFTARLTHQGQHALFKQDRWGQPIVTERDEYGNPSEHAHWVVMRSSRFMVQEEETYYLGDRENEEVWQTYLAEGESAEDTDDEEQEQEQQEDEPQEDEPQEHQFPPIPQLKRSTNVNALGGLSLEFPLPDVYQEEECEAPEINETALRKLFNFPESSEVSVPTADSLTRKDLYKLSNGTFKF